MVLLTIWMNVLLVTDRWNSPANFGINLSASWKGFDLDGLDRFRNDFMDAKI